MRNAETQNMPMMGAEDEGVHQMQRQKEKTKKYILMIKT